MQNNAAKSADVHKITENLKGEEGKMNAAIIAQQQANVVAAFAIDAKAVNGTHLAVNPGSLRMSFLEKGLDGKVYARAAIIMELPNVIELYKALDRMFRPVLEAEQNMKEEIAEKKAAEAATSDSEKGTQEDKSETLKG